jgi:hypothetical protein
VKARRASDIEIKRPRKTRWGKFYLKGKYTLYCDTGLGSYRYPIYLDRMTTSAAVLGRDLPSDAQDVVHGAGLQRSARRHPAGGQSASAFVQRRVRKTQKRRKAIKLPGAYNKERARNAIAQGAMREKRKNAPRADELLILILFPGN